MKYRIGWHIPGKYGTKDCGGVTMCRDDAPEEWHEKIYHCFDAISWQMACQEHDKYIQICEKEILVKKKNVDNQT